MMEDGWPLIATLHHPITVDRDLDLARDQARSSRSRCAAGTASSRCRCKVAAPAPAVVTVSESSPRDIVAQMGVPADRLHIVPVGVDPQIVPPHARDRAGAGPHHDDGERRRPDEGPGAAARGGGQGAHRARDAELVVIGKPKAKSKIPARSSTASASTDAVQFVSGVTDRAHRRALRRGGGRGRAVALRGLLAARRSRPWRAVCPLVATTGGALPEVVGTDGETGLLVPAGRPGRAGRRHRQVLDDPACGRRSARPAATGCSTASRGARPPKARSSKYEELLGRTRAAAGHR